MRLSLVYSIFAALALCASPAWAQLPGMPQTAAEPAPPPSLEARDEDESPDSPRAALREFLQLAAQADFAQAAHYLALPDGEESRGPELARRLHAVLQRHLEIDLDTLSPATEGRLQDGLPAGVEQLGELPDERGGEDPVSVVRIPDADRFRWVFSSQTVSRIDRWYDALPDRWIRDRIPGTLLQPGPAGLLLWWQWLAVPALLLLALALGRLLGTLTRAVLLRFTRRTKTEWDERLLQRVSPALALVWAVAAAAVLLPWLALLPGPERWARSLLGAAATVSVFWALWRSVDVSTSFLSTRPGVADNPSARSLVALLRNFAKAFVAVGGLLATLAAFGYPVTTVLAGLGIGGIALAFGAQKSVENLFGSVALAVDQPFRLGDFVRIEDFVGHVERIGMRSTQIRTLDRTLISIPNGRLSEMRIEDFASRDRIRLVCTVGVVYGTTREQVERIIAGMQQVLRDHPLIWPDTVVVRFAGFGDSSLDIEVMAWFRTSDYNVFRDCRQEALLGFMRVVEEAGSSFAFPTRTVHLVSEPPAR